MAFHFTDRRIREINEERLRSLKPELVKAVRLIIADVEHFGHRLTIQPPYKGPHGMASQEIIDRTEKQERGGAVAFCFVTKKDYWLYYPDYLIGARAKSLGLCWGGDMAEKNTLYVEMPELYRVPNLCGNPRRCRKRITWPGFSKVGALGVGAVLSVATVVLYIAYYEITH